jgi:hypothetical protein
MTQKYIFKKLLARDIKVILYKQRVLEQIREKQLLKSQGWWLTW